MGARVALSSATSRLMFDLSVFSDSQPSGRSADFHHGARFAHGLFHYAKHGHIPTGEVCR
jgi:hypothetical protein